MTDIFPDDGLGTEYLWVTSWLSQEVSPGISTSLLQMVADLLPGNSKLPVLQSLSLKV